MGWKLIFPPFFMGIDMKKDKVKRKVIEEPKKEIRKPRVVQSDLRKAMNKITSRGH